MKILIIYASFHKKNTEKLALVLEKNLEAKLVKFDEFNEELDNYDLIGFGSGVYLAKFHRGLIYLVKNFEKQANKKAFIFSTAGMKKNFVFNRSHSHFRKLLNDKGFQVVDEFSCLAHDSYGFLKFFGGINKGRPNYKDLEDVRKFALNLKNI